jgi:hypothetical protein
VAAYKEDHVAEKKSKKDYTAFIEQYLDDNPDIFSPENAIESADDPKYQEHADAFMKAALAAGFDEADIDQWDTEDDDDDEDDTEKPDIYAWIEKSGGDVDYQDIDSVRDLASRALDAGYDDNALMSYFNGHEINPMNSKNRRSDGKWDLREKKVDADVPEDVDIDALLYEAVMSMPDDKRSAFLARFSKGDISAPDALDETYGPEAIPSPIAESIGRDSANPLAKLIGSLKF